MRRVTLIEGADQVGVLLFPLAQALLEAPEVGVGRGDAAVDGGEVAVEAVDHLPVFRHLPRELLEALGRKAGGAGGLVQLATRLFHLRADVLALVFESLFRLLLPGHASRQSERKGGRSEASAEEF